MTRFPLIAKGKESKQRETKEPVYIRSINDSSTKLYAPENARDQVAFGFSLVLDWLIGLYRFLD